MQMLTEPMTAADRAQAKAEREAWDAMEKRIAVLRHALEMVQDADNDCHKDGLPTMPKAARAAVDFALGSIEQTDPE